MKLLLVNTSFAFLILKLLLSYVLYGRGNTPSIAFTRYHVVLPILVFQKLVVHKKDLGVRVIAVFRHWCLLHLWDKLRHTY